MKVRLERSFPIAASPDTTWSVLADIEAVAGCMPGAKITERIDDTHYKGTVAVKLGPANMTFRGEIEVVELNPVERRMRLVAKGRDTTGASVAEMDLTARVEPAADGTSTLIGNSEASVGGKAAAFGGRLMDAVSEQILKQFGANFTAKVAAAQAAASTAPAPVAEASGPATALKPAAAGSAPPAQPQELNGLALLWAIIKDWFRGIFGRKR